MKPMLKTCFVLAFFSFANNGFSQNNDTIKTSILWQISGNGLKSNSYLLGTIHIRCGEDFMLPKKVVEKLKTCTAFYEETDAFEPVGYNQFIEGVKWDKKLDSLLGDSLFNAAALLFENKTKRTLKEYNETQPFITVFTLTAKNLHCKKPVFMEKELFKFANKNNIDVYGIETAKEHFEVVKNLPDTFQINYLLWHIFNTDSIAYFNTQSAKKFTNNTFFNDANKRFNNPNNFNSIIDKVLLFDRNKSWIPTMKFRMAIESTFFAFGASHLVSNSGLVALLKQEGYTLTAIEL